MTDTGTGSGSGQRPLQDLKGQHYDFMGECEVSFPQSKEFRSGLGLDVSTYVRIRRDMSFQRRSPHWLGCSQIEVRDSYLNGVANAGAAEAILKDLSSCIHPPTSSIYLKCIWGARARKLRSLGLRIGLD
jgi:hypothetical protein